MSKYDYLKEYIIPRGTSKVGNTFYTITSSEVSEAEEKIGCKFSHKLVYFWLNVGAGFFESTSAEIGITQKYYSNRLLPPEDIVSILTEGEEGGLITEQGMEFLKEGDLPFFEVEGFTSYLVMKPNSEHPDAVYDIDGSIVEGSLETFIWKLYHVSPTYYLDNL